MIRRILFGLLLLVGLVLVFCVIYVTSRQNLTYDVPFPAITASTDTSVIARGRYVVQDVAVCASCHGDPSQRAAIARGDVVSMSGGHRFSEVPGTFYAANITSDSATGIGGLADGAIARALRNGLRHDGRVLLPYMEFQGLSDEDLAAIVSYLRTLPPVRHPVPAQDPNLLGRIVLATALSRPVGPKTAPPHESPAGPRVENGRYLVGSVAGCGGCHTQRDPQTGSVTGAQLAGARAAIQDPSNPRRFWSPRNITAAPKTGRLAAFTEDEFVARFRKGRIVPGSPMPWENFRRMKEDDLRAIYRFLKTVPAVENDPGPTFVDKR